MLFTSRGNAGHVTPLAPFATALRDAGHEVLVAAQGRFRHHVERTGLPFAPFPSPPDEESAALMMRLPGMGLDEANDGMLQQYFCRLDGRSALPALLPLVARWRPDVIVRETWEFASVLAGELTGTPVVRIALGIGETEALTDALVAGPLDELRVEAGLPPRRGHPDAFGALRLTMAPAALDQATPADRAPLRFRPALTPPDPAGALPTLAWAAAGGAPLVYLTLGSVAPSEHMPFFPALYRDAIAALARLPIRLLVTLGDDRPVDALGPLPPNVRVERWLPQDAVLRHATAVVVHGGYGSTLGALAHGRPPVVLPLFSVDQWITAGAVARAGAGIALDAERRTRRVLDLPGTATVAALAPAVQRVLADPRYARRAQRSLPTWRPPRRLATRWRCWRRSGRRAEVVDQLRSRREHVSQRPRRVPGQPWHGVGEDVELSRGDRGVRGHPAVDLEVRRPVVRARGIGLAQRLVAEDDVAARGRRQLLGDLLERQRLRPRELVGLAVVPIAGQHGGCDVGHVVARHRCHAPRAGRPGDHALGRGEPGQEVQVQAVA